MLQVTENLMGFVQHCRCLKPVWVSCYFDMDSSCLLVVCFVFYVTLVYCNVFYMFYSTVTMQYNKLLLPMHTRGGMRVMAHVWDGGQEMVGACERWCGGMAQGQHEGKSEKGECATWNGVRDRCGNGLLRPVVEKENIRTLKEKCKKCRNNKRPMIEQTNTACEWPLSHTRVPQSNS